MLQDFAGRLKTASFLPQAGVSRLATVGMNGASIVRALDAARTYAEVFAIVGHELGHYWEWHILKGIMLGGLFVVLCIALAAYSGTRTDRQTIDASVANQVAPLSPLEPGGTPLSGPPAGPNTAPPNNAAPGSQAPAAQSTSTVWPQERHTRWWWLSPTRAS